MVLRDRLFVEDDAVPYILGKFRKIGVHQALVLSTCDRVEVQAFVHMPEDENEVIRRILEVLAEHAELSPQEFEGQTYAYWDDTAVRQIFAVASSLDSLIIGEPQVLGQVKAGHRIAMDSGMTGQGLEAILQAAYSCAKRVRNETSIGERPVSIAAAATQLAEDLHGNLKTCSALLIGGGEMGELVSADLQASGLGQLMTTHPSERRAEEAAKRLGCHILSFDEMEKNLSDYDIILTSLGRRRHTVTQEMVSSAISNRRHKPVFLIDTAIPGDIDPAVERISDAFLYDLNDLERVAMEGRVVRENESGAAWKIIDEELTAFMKGQAERIAVPTLNLLRNHFEDVREQALKDAGGDAEKATRLLINRLLHAPSETLRQEAGAKGLKNENPEWRDKEEMIVRIFGLEENKE